VNESLELQPITEVGAWFVELAEKHAAEIATRAEEHDRAGTFPREAFESMKESGFLKAPVPEAFGGRGLTSVHDLGVGVSRLARGDGSVAIASNMHLTFALVGARSLRGAEETGDQEQIDGLSNFMQLLGQGSIAMANATEPGTDLRHPLTEVTAAGDGTLAVNGHKIFGTLSEIADIFFVPSRRRRDDGTMSMGFAFVFRGMAGQDIKSNWNALGMRASGSHDVVYDNCVVPESLFLTEDADWGSYDTTGLIVASAGNFPLVCSSLGIAEAAAAIAADMACTRKKAPSGRPIAERRGVQHMIAEIEVDLAVCRGMLDSIGRVLDAHVSDRPVTDLTIDDMHRLNKEFQCAKLVVNRKAIDIVDKALSVSGGAGYMTASPLSRLYRDVRAGPFMQPFSPVEAHEYIGKVALGLDPALDG
jgi:alkylation response protein AidB-like acyl-CoA dehydrogenase